MKAVVALGSGKTYTDDTTIGLGAIKGAPCTIKSINKVNKTNTVTFEWTGTNGATQISTMDVKDGADPNEIASLIIDEVDNHLKATMVDGTIFDCGEMPQEPVKISAESGNALTNKADGLYVSATGIEISADADNAIKTKSDGLYVQKIKISTKADNIIKEETDGLYVPKADAQIQADFNQIDNTKADFIKNKPTVDQTYSATSENAQSGKAVASGIATEVAKYSFLNKEIATKAEIDGYVADPTKAKFNIIYLFKDASAKGADKYFEYQRIGNETSSTFEMTGDTSTDLTDYIKKDAIVKAFSATLSDEKIASEKLVKDSLDAKVDIQQKAEDKGKALVVGADGKVVLETIKSDTTSIEKSIADNWGGNGYNLVPYPPYRASGYKHYDCTYTNTDEWITATREEGSTATSDSYYHFTPVYDTLPEGKYALILEGDIDSSTTFRLGVDRRKTDASHDYVNRYVTGGLNVKEVTFEYNDSADDVAPQCWICFTHGSSAINATFRAMLVRINEDETYPTEYQRYASGNVKLTDKIDELDKLIKETELKLAEIKMLGWNVPDDFPIKNEISGSEFVQRVGRISLKELGWEADGIGVGDITVFRTPMPLDCKKYANSTKWNIAVSTTYTTRALVSDYKSDVASNDFSVGGRSAGGNYIEFSSSWYKTARDFKEMMDSNDYYLYYEKSYAQYTWMAGNEITARHREVIKLGTIQTTGTTSSSLYVDDDIMEYYDEVKFAFQTYPLGGGSSYKMVIGKDSISKEDVELFPSTDLYVPFGGAFADYYGQIDPPSYNEDDNQTIFRAGVSGKPSNFSDVLVHIFAIKYW